MYVSNFITFCHSLLRVKGEYYFIYLILFVGALDSQCIVFVLHIYLCKCVFGASWCVIACVHMELHHLSLWREVNICPSSFFHSFVGVLHFQCIVYILHIHCASVHLKLCGVLLQFFHQHFCDLVCIFFKFLVLEHCSTKKIVVFYEDLWKHFFWKS